MSSKTIALILLTMCTMVHIITDYPKYFIGMCIFASVYLIVDEIKNGSKKS